MKMFSKTGVVAFTLVLCTVATSNATASGWRTKLSDMLDTNGFGVLLFALDATDLTDTLESSRVTLFAPTDDVFVELAEALGCTDSDGAGDPVALAESLGDLLPAVLKYHASLGRTPRQSLLIDGRVSTVLGPDLAAGVDKNGLFVKGASNETASTITTGGIWGRRFVVYPINQVLLPPLPENTVLGC